jgi:hypothetical protein
MGTAKKQKFPRGTRVKVDDEMPASMSHFECGFFGIVAYTYHQEYGGGNTRSYCLVVLDKNNWPINMISWYDESQLTLVSYNLEAGLKIIEKYNYG